MERKTVVLFTCGLWIIQSILPALVIARHCGDKRPCQCGDVVDKDYRLSADLGPCERRGLAVASGATLDCAGHAIRGSGEHSRDFGVALSDGVTGATVKNCDISEFSRGIRLRGATKNQIVHNTVHHNGDFTTHVGYGIDVAGAQENVFQDNYVHHNADEGIHTGTGSHGNTFIGNRVEDNARENFYFLRADRGVLQRNQTRGGGANSVFIKHSSFLRLEHNVFYDKPVTLRGDAHDNLLIDNEFVKTGVFFQAYEEHGTVSHPTKNEVTGGTITDAKECVKFSGASGNTIRNISLVNCRMKIVAKDEAESTENTVVGVMVQPEAVALDATSVVHVGWRLDITVQDDKGAPVVGAHVQGFDAQKRVVFDATTGPDGKIPPQDMVSYSLQGSKKISLTPYRIQVSSGQKTAVQEVSVSENAAITISLH